MRRRSAGLWGRPRRGSRLGRVPGRRRWRRCRPSAPQRSSAIRSWPGHLSPLTPRGANSPQFAPRPAPRVAAQRSCRFSPFQHLRRLANLRTAGLAPSTKKVCPTKGAAAAGAARPGRLRSWACRGSAGLDARGGAPPRRTGFPGASRSAVLTRASVASVRRRAHRGGTSRSLGVARWPWRSGRDQLGCRLGPSR